MQTVSAQAPEKGAELAECSLVSVGLHEKLHSIHVHIKP